MNIKTRRILFVIFILAFVFISFIVLSYAAGYKITLNGKKPLQKTGMLVLDTVPRGAKIFLNNKPEQPFLKKYLSRKENFITTPAKIKNLTPGEYDVKFELDGYWEWEKKLKVEPGLSTFAEDVNLFKKDLPIIVSEGEKIEIALSPSNEYLAAAAQNENFLINLKTGEKISLISSPDKPLNKKNSVNQPILWSFGEKKLIINNILYSGDNFSQSINLNKIIKQSWQGIRFGNNNDEIYFFSQTENGGAVYGLNLTTKKITTIITSNGRIIDSLIKDKNIFIIAQSGKSANLEIYEIGSKNPTRNIEFPVSSDYQFINPNHKLTNLYDKKHQILYLINPLSYLPVEEIINNVKYARWVKENKLLYANDFEIWLSDFNSAGVEQKKLLTRLSEPINGILWHPSNNYLIYYTDSAVKSLELDEREKHNTTELFNPEKISNAFINKKGDILYFIGKIGGKEGLYKLAIQ